MYDTCDNCGKSLKDEHIICQDEGFCEPCLEQEARCQDDWCPED